MPEKPTFASVTDVPCTCGFLQRSADEPSIPIVYDEHVGEFHVQCADGGTLILYHCPFCGGAAPPSKCGSLFANVSAAEQERLLMMTEGFHSVEDVIKALGPADEDYPRGAQWRQPEKES
ncbi:MAG TPA: hypothetical protein VMB50_01515, partial [Myxococcales bacterium]|nr:hypothetical protein [Myxococcales bacterium]